MVFRQPAVVPVLVLVLVLALGPAAVLCRPQSAQTGTHPGGYHSTLLQYLAGLQQGRRPTSQQLESSREIQQQARGQNQQAFGGNQRQVFGRNQQQALTAPQGQASAPLRQSLAGNGGRNRATSGSAAGGGRPVRPSAIVFPGPVSGR